MAAPLISLRGAALTIGGKRLFDGLGLDLQPQARVCLIGRNGAGKSTLLQVMAGSIELDAGERFVAPRTLVSYLPQEPELPVGTDLTGAVLEGLSAIDRDARPVHLAEQLLAELGMDAHRSTEALSGGERRRVSIARALVANPDVLLLDEPTNHLDLPAIEWLEARLAAFGGALVCISHDRRFLESTSRTTWWLDRATLAVNEAGYAAFEAWRESVLDAEQRSLERLTTRLAAEQHWLHRGVTARRRRNQGRLRRLDALRAARADLLRRDATGRMRAAHEAGGGALVIEAEGLTKRFGATTIVENFSTRIMRGDRIGIIGPNGSGKTTLIRLLLGELAPDRGRVTQGTNIALARFDQQRIDLDEAATPWQLLCPDGGDRVTAGGTSRHVVGYLGDFLFRESQARQPIEALSGGERSRLLLAKILTRPSNLLVLDEPTNDLDLETLDLLEELLEGYRGTVLLVSHDRDFLDRTVTSTIVLDHGGRAMEYAGGYSDHLRQRAARVPPVAAGAGAGKAGPQRPAEKTRSAIDRRRERELERLPARIEELGRAIALREAALQDPDLYERDPDALARLGREIEAIGAERAALEDRWLDLALRAEA
ncbi:MAG: ATP-binding cassette domain-containing protein [Geminicoccaceae bacterium]|nr:ATP-binding cassette domain-containing protein [Geminicoccaceae bacterium]